jgi:hypothetical protein
MIKKYAYQKWQQLLPNTKHAITVEPMDNIIKQVNNSIPVEHAYRYGRTCISVEIRVHSAVDAHSLALERLASRDLEPRDIKLDVTITSRFCRGPLRSIGIGSLPPELSSRSRTGTGRLSSVCRRKRKGPTGIQTSNTHALRLRRTYFDRAEISNSKGFTIVLQCVIRAKYIKYE